MSLPPEPRTAPDSGVIHNIGYRGYQGPRLGRSYATRSLFVQSLRGAYGLGRSGKSKVLPMLILGGLGAIALMIVTATLIAKQQKLLMDYTAFLSTFGLLITIFLAAQAPVLMSRDLRHNTVPLYFSRPITRGDYVRAKFAAMTAAMLILMVTPLLVLYIGAVLGKLPFGTNTEHFLYALVAAVLYAVLFAAIALLIAAATPRRGFGVAAIMGVLVVSNILATIAFGINGGFEGRDSANWVALLSPQMLVESVVNRTFGLGGDGAVIHAPSTFAAVVFGVEIVTIAVLCYVSLLRRYRKI
ncbi:ABC transporter permease subunit [Kitasatospora sp. NPDC048540]|uniref:ABC transporter permease n=1 Tax=unclassified Kitasatospora TaxID=2633591 RepID=UPI00053B77AB|nr:ABC transporter permease subunit [Kitasatospora sp. MBT63]